MLKKPLTISLVIPAYNEESHLRACLQAALEQSSPFNEIIVVDNNSSDATAAVVHQFSGVKLLQENHQGIVYARNRGFRTAQADIIARIDADTILPPNWAAHILAFYRHPQHASSAWTSSGRFRDVPLPSLVSAGYQLVTVGINRWLTGHPALWGSSMALPSKLWQQVAAETCIGGGFHEDLDLAMHLHQQGYSIFWDHSIQVSALLRHAWVPPRELWDYLQWWPRTLKRHKQLSWLLCWLGGALAMFGPTLLLAYCRRWRQATKNQAAQLPSAFDV